MKTKALKVARIGNSRGVRLPADTLRRYGIGDLLLMEERAEGILLHPPADADARLVMGGYRPGDGGQPGGLPPLGRHGERWTG